MKALINQTLTLAKQLTATADRVADRLVMLEKCTKPTASNICEVARHHQLMKNIRQIRNHYNQQSAPSTNLRWPLASEEDRLGDWVLSFDLISDIAKEIQPKHPFPLNSLLMIVEDVLLAAEKTYPLAQAKQTPIQ